MNTGDKSSSEHYLYLMDNINKCAQASGRNPADITLITVTKNCEWQQILPIYETGCRNFGESRIQEALTKIPLAPNNINWHFIGTLQKNKVAKVVQHFNFIHSVDSFELAQKISISSTEAGKITPIFLQVNTSQELTKHGFKTLELKSMLDSLLSLPALSLEGLMTIGPKTNNEKIIRNCFSQLRNLRDELKIMAGNNAPMIHLSMGMSHDYLLAIQEGATLLRIGTAIFHSSR